MNCELSFAVDFPIDNAEDPKKGKEVTIFDPVHLREAEVFSGLNGQELSKLANMATARRHASGSQIFAMGDRADRLFIIERGKVELKLPVSILGTTREISLETLSSGQAVGWSALLHQHSLTMSAIAAVDCELVSFSRSDLVGALESDPQMGWKVMSNLTGIIVRRLRLAQAMLVRQLQNSLDDGLHGGLK